MKKILSVLAIVVSVSLAGAAHADKIDLQLKMLIDQPEAAKAMLGKAVVMRDGVEQVDVLVKSFDIDLTAAAIEGAGGTVRSVIGDIMTAFVPVDFIPELAEMGEVSGIEASKRLNLFMDTARSNTGVATLQSGYEGVSYNGENVVVGVIDTGLDYSRNDFDNSEAASRVQYLRFQTSSSANSMTVVECANDTVIDGTCSIAVTNDSAASHGTHVTGIAAGSDGTYTGNAPAADIMLVRNDFYDDIDEGTGTFSGGVLDGVTEIFKKSDILDKPAVINLSQGTHIGAHDDTSLLEQGINSAVGGGYASGGKSYGRAVVVAAGNEHIVEAAVASIADRVGGIHASFDVSSGSSQAWRLWVIDISDQSGVYAPGRTPLIVDAWFGAGQSEKCSVAANSYPYTSAFGGSTTTTDAVAATGDILISSEENSTNSSSDSKVSVIVATDASDSQNNKPRALFGFGPVTASDGWRYIETDFSSTGYVMDVIIRASGGSCTGNMWIEGGGTYVNFMKGLDTGAFDVGDGDHGGGYVFSGEGDSNMTVDIPGTASGVITVGAYLQEKPYDGQGRSQWTASDGTTYDATDIDEPSDAQVNGGTVGSRCPFSSIGPTADGRIKPDLLAPGDPIISTLASGYTPASALLVNSTHFKMQGTSQATPQITGLVALLFQKNNTLTASQAKSALTGTATGAMIVGKANNQNGYGKVSATAAAGSISADSSGYSGTGSLTTEDIENDDVVPSSSTGCGSTIAPVGTSSAALIVFLTLAPALIVAIRRRRP